MKKIFLVLFSLIMMCSVSFALEVNTTYTFSVPSFTSATSAGDSFGDYSIPDITMIMQNLNSDFDNSVFQSQYKAMTNQLDSLNVGYVLYKSLDGTYIFCIGTPAHPNVVFGVDKDRNLMGWLEQSHTEFRVTYFLIGKSGYSYYAMRSSSSLTIHGVILNKTPNSNFNVFVDEIIDCNNDVYTMTETTTNNKYYWDGANYFYKAPSQGGGTGDIPEDVTDLTDEQIAEIVERFINSNAYLEKAYYNGDYFITYDKLTGYFRGYSYAWNIDLAIEYGNYNEEGEFVTTGTKEGEAWRIRPYEFSGDIFNKFGDWLASKFNTYSFEYFSISPDSTIKPRYVGSLEHNYCSNYKENEVVIYSSKQIRYVGEETDAEGKTETVVTDNYIPSTVLKDSETGEQIVIRDNLQESSDSLETIITPNADFSGLKEAFEKYISFIDISSITWLTTAISSMITIFVPFVALGIIIFLINRILNGGS